MSRNIALRKLTKPQHHHPPQPQLLKLPDLSSSVSAVTPATTATTAQTQLTHLTTVFQSYFKNSPIAITPKELLHFLKSRLRHHPTLGHLDFHLFRYAATLDSFRHDHSTFEYMVRSLVSTDRLDSLRSLLEFISSNPCPCSDAREIRKGIEFYGRMIRDRVKPDAVTFNTLISGYCRNNKFGLALDVFREMKEKGCVPNVISFNTLIKGFFQDGKAEEAGNVMEAADLMLEFLRKGVLPRGFDYFVLIEMLCHVGKVDRAFEMVDELWGKGYTPSLIACTTLIEGLRRVGRIENSVFLMRKMLNEGIIPDTVTFSCLLQDMCGVGRAMEANKLRLLGSKKGLDPDGMMYRILISGYTKEGRRKEGEVLVNEMLDRGFLPDIATYNMLMDGLAKSKF
ncbi:hypothetical protein DH2020_018115 [Rehmannia glutinosa]|uniref:Pentatricopeptide repeat-containing protein n=1 Tax=Rehmannia glutinosa TaxID=99300 RepID=A0ABR0WHZ2_REHGL